MSTRTIVELVGGALLLALLFLVGLEEFRKHDDLLRASVKAEADRENIAERDKSLKASEAQYQAQLADKEKQVETLIRLTSAQIAAKAQEHIPSLPEAVHAVTAEDAKQAPQLHEGDLIVPKSDVQPLAKNQLDFEVCKLDRDKCNADLVDWKGKYALSEDQTAQWKKVATGGSAIGRALKCAAVRGGVGAAAGAGGAAMSGDSKNAVRGMSFGAVIGLGSCFIWR